MSLKFVISNWYNVLIISLISGILISCIAPPLILFPPPRLFCFCLDVAVSANSSCIIFVNSFLSSSRVFILSISILVNILLPSLILLLLISVSSSSISFIRLFTSDFNLSVKFDVINDVDTACSGDGSCRVFPSPSSRIALHIAINFGIPNLEGWLVL